MPTTQRILQLAPIAQYLAANYIRKRSLFGGTSISREQVRWIYVYNKILQKIYAEDPTYPIQNAANYLFELIQPYYYRAAYIYDGGGGGSVVPPSPTTIPTTIPTILDFIVDSNSVIATGDTSVDLSGYNYKGYNINFFRSGQPQYTTDPGDGSNYYSWNSYTAILTISGAAVAGEPMRITPVV